MNLKNIFFKALKIEDPWYIKSIDLIDSELIIDVDSKKLIGAQIIGEGHFAKRIDVMALAVQQKLEIDDLIGLDMAYSPPYAPVWDPFLIATNNAFENLRKLEGK